MPSQYKNPRPIDLQVARALRFWRGLDGLLQKEIAVRCGLHRATYGRYENARSCPTLSQFARLARGLDVSLYMLTLTMEALA